MARLPRDFKPPPPLPRPGSGGGERPHERAVFPPSFPPSSAVAGPARGTSTAGPRRLQPTPAAIRGAGLCARRPLAPSPPLGAAGCGGVAPAAIRGAGSAGRPWPPAVFLLLPSLFLFVFTPPRLGHQPIISEPLVQLPEQTEGLVGMSPGTFASWPSPPLPSPGHRPQALPSPGASPRAKPATAAIPFPSTPTSDRPSLPRAPARGRSPPPPSPHAPASPLSFAGSPGILCGRRPQYLMPQEPVRAGELSLTLKCSIT